jgi:hypothetical protein
MLELISAIARRSVSGLVESPRPRGIRSWIEGGTFLIENNNSSDDITLGNIVLTEFVSYQAYDFQRFALSSYESARVFAEDRSGRSLSWALITAYYAAYYASHAIFRALGRSFLHLEARQARILNELSEVYLGQPINITAGSFCANLNSTGASVVLSRDNHSGGSHELFWQVFCAFLASLASDIASRDDPNAMISVAFIEEIRTILLSCGFNQGNWLSAMRNEITYQHLHGVWFPINASKKDKDFIKNFSIKGLSLLRLDFDPKKHPLCAFLSCSMTLAQLSLELCTFMVERSGGNNPSFSGPFKRIKEEWPILGQSISRR